MENSAEWTVEQVLRAVDLVPPGCVVSYGDIADLIGSTPRRVGTIMARHGAAVAWWRVTNAAGALPPGLLPRAREHWAAEGLTTDPDATRVRIAAHRADLVAWAAAYDRDR
ncbi:MGMT family protein [Granulicoccus phenolivorans]|uniref:MGMT family protein n=1 Tax=Granulicoccus phenolivorans TaxID=266854 RepID=UPI0005557FC9|nr:MGMT family protein [Granulicoccus phenolivorans]